MGYSVYKGKAALTVEPRPPEFSPLYVCFVVECILRWSCGMEFHYDKCMLVLWISLGRLSCRKRAIICSSLLLHLAFDK